jgi:two-component system KDP operon response regulator KdpE
MKILLIDDDPAMTEMLKLILQAAVIEVYTANSGKDGIRLTKEVSPNVVILDLMMPEMDGWQVCDNIRSFSKVPILILSALDNPGLVARALDAGADDYLIKPVPSGVLIAHLQKLIRRSKAIQQEVLTTSSSS